jgi:hypothetical protein
MKCIDTTTTINKKPKGAGSIIIAKICSDLLGSG